MPLSDARMTTRRPETSCSARRRRQNSRMSDPAAAKSAWRAARTSATIGSCQAPVCLGVSIIGLLYELVRCAENRGRKPVSVADVFDSSAQRRVRDMGDVPGQQKVHAMVPRDGDVCCVGGRLRWKRHALDQRRGRFGHSRSHVKQWEIRYECSPTLSHLGISGSHLGKHHLRDVQIERRSPLFPPGVRQLLPSRHNEVPTRSASQVADNAGFDVGSAPHPLMLLLVASLVTPSGVLQTLLCHPWRLTNRRRRRQRE
jgi:hypothetical protein